MSQNTVTCDHEVLAEVNRPECSVGIILRDGKIEVHILTEPGYESTVTFDEWNPANGRSLMQVSIEQDEEGAEVHHALTGE